MGVRVPPELLNMINKAIKTAGPILGKLAKIAVDEIYQDVLPLLGVSRNRATVVGSIGKKGPAEWSNDIDLAIEKKAFSGDPFDVLIDRIKSIDQEVKDIRSLGVISCSYPLRSLEITCQLDIMLVEDLIMAKFFYWAPYHGVSQYKGVHRTILLATLASYVDRHSTNNWRGIPTEWKRYFFESTGLYYGDQSIASLKDGSPTKTRRTISKYLVSVNPTDITKILLGPSGTLYDTDSFEHLFSAIQSSKFPYPKLVPKILKRTVVNMNAAKITIPKELQCISV